MLISIPVSLHTNFQSPSTYSSTVRHTKHTRCTQIFTCVKERLTQQRDTPLPPAYNQDFPLLLNLLPSSTLCLHSDLCTAEVCLRQGSSRQATAHSPGHVIHRYRYRLPRQVMLPVIIPEFRVPGSIPYFRVSGIPSSLPSPRP